MAHPINLKILDIIDEMDVTVAEFSKQLGFNNPGKIYNIVKNRNKVSTDVLEAIANRYPHIDMNQVLRNNSTGGYFQNHKLTVVNESESPYNSEVEKLRAELDFKNKLIERLENQLKDKEEIIELLRAKGR